MDTRGQITMSTSPQSSPKFGAKIGALGCPRTEDRSRDAPLCVVLGQACPGGPIQTNGGDLGGPLGYALSLLSCVLAPQKC
jgi:hypothetical protein